MGTSGRYESAESGSNIGTAVTFLLIGLGAGALMGLMFAPKPGKQFRRDLQRGYEDAKGNFGDWADEAKDRVREVSERVRDAASWDGNSGQKTAVVMADAMPATPRWLRPVAHLILQRAERACA